MSPNKYTRRYQSMMDTESRTKNGLFQIYLIRECNLSVCIVDLFFKFREESMQMECFSFRTLTIKIKVNFGEYKASDLFALYILIRMKESPIKKRCVKMDPIQSKMHLIDFSSPVKKCQIDLRKNEKDDELYCEICNKIFRFEGFKEHIVEHQRKPKEKIPTLSQIYERAMSKVSRKVDIKSQHNTKFQSKQTFSGQQISQSSQNFIKSLESKQNIELTQTQYFIPSESQNYEILTSAILSEKLQRDHSKEIFDEKFERHENNLDKHSKMNLEKYGNNIDFEKIKSKY